MYAYKIEIHTTSRCKKSSKSLDLEMWSFNVQLYGLNAIFMRMSFSFVWFFICAIMFDNHWWMKFIHIHLHSSLPTYHWIHIHYKYVHEKYMCFFHTFFSMDLIRYLFFIPLRMTPNKALIICCHKTIVTLIRVSFGC